MKSRVHIVSLSGGKDSAATLLYAFEKAVSPLRAVFADTGHEHPATYDYVDYLEDVTGLEVQRVRANFDDRIAGKRRYIEEKWADDGVPQDRIDRALELLHPTGNPMLDLCLWKGRMPSTKARFCTEELKVRPIINEVMIPALSEFDKVWSWQGVRRDESRARARLRRMDREHDLPNVYNFRPILHWTAAQVFEYHARHGVEPNPLYKQGMGRVGCMPCINARKAELAEISRRFPDEIARVAEWEALVSQVAKRGSTTWFASVTHSPSDDEVHYTTHGIEKAVEWSLTVRGGRQRDWVTAEDEIPMCNSIYGLCE